MLQNRTNVNINNKYMGGDDGDPVSDFDEFVLHKEGNEEIHITGKARKQLKWPLFTAHIQKSELATPIILDSPIKSTDTKDITHGFSPPSHKSSEKRRAGQKKYARRDRA